MPAKFRGGDLVAVDAAVDDAYSIADAQFTRPHLVEGDRAAVVETDDDAVTIGAVRALDLVADGRAAERTRDRGRGVAAAAAELMTDDAARDAADDRAEADRCAASAAIHVDRFDDAVLGALRDDRSAIDRVGLGVCAASDDCGGHDEQDCDAAKLHANLQSLSTLRDRPIRQG